MKLMKCMIKDVKKIVHIIMRMKCMYSVLIRLIKIKIKSNNLYLRRLQSSSTAYNRDSKSVFVASNSVILSVLIVQYDTT